MKVKIERSINNAYLLIEEDSPKDDFNKENAFEIQMLKDNEIGGILPLNSGCGEYSYMYPVRGLITLSDKYESRELRSQDLAMIIRGLHEGLSNLEEYMIKTDHVLLDPTLLFSDNTTGELRICVYPLSESSIKEELKKLAEFIISKADHNENKAIDLAYGLYRQVMAGDYRFDELIMEDIKPKTENINPGVQKNDNSNPVGMNPKRRAEEHGNAGKTIVGLLVATIVIFCFALCVLMLYFR